MEVGDKIGTYLITEVMTGGGMSELYKVAVADIPSRFVLKRCKEDAEEEKVKLFRREIRILKSLHHKNIIEVTHDCTDENPPYYVMPACSKSMVDIALSDDILYKIRLSIQMCEGINYIHQSGSRHRDIKPGNILIDKDGIVKIVDFGLSRFVNRDTTTLTQTGLIAGTAGYIPPEYKDGAFEDGTVEGDIYMLGKTLYYIFSFGGDVSNVRPGNVPYEIEKIIEKSIRENPEERYLSVEPIISELKEYEIALVDLESRPKPIKEIKKLYKCGTKEFRHEVFKTLSSHTDASGDWAETLSHLSREELTDVLKNKRDYVSSLTAHFVENLSHPSDFIQFSDIDEFVKFADCILKVSQDTAINQQLLSQLILMANIYNRWPAMEGLAKILNNQIKSDPVHYRSFIYNHREDLREFKKQLHNNPFDSDINSIL